MKLPVRLPTTEKTWLIILGLWTLFLSGLVADVVGSPGVIQLLHLQSLLRDKEKLVLTLRDELTHLEADSVQLEKSRIVQQREIRRVLGYAAQDELIFDFSTSSQL